MAITDKFSKPSNGSQPLPAQLSAQKVSGATTASLSLATGWDTTTVKHVRMYQTQVVNGQTIPDQSTLSFYAATLAGTTLSNLTLIWSATGSDQTYPAGATVDLSTTAELLGRLADGLAVSLDQSGNIVASTTATFNANIDIADSSTAIRDSSDNELVKFTKTASAVNEITVTNAATGSGPTLSATGGDTNISMNITAKGTGRVVIDAAGAPATATVATVETSSSTSYTDLATSGPAVTVTIGNSGRALVELFNSSGNNTLDILTLTGFAISGASTVAATDTYSLGVRGPANLTQNFSNVFYVSGLTPGSTTFTAKYRVVGNTGSWAARRISVIPL